ncbi:MAG: hypothetical protein Q8R29_00480 [bacterium]|nr:hypothetical protein [bacterium]
MFKKFDTSRVKYLPLADRQNKMTVNDILSLDRAVFVGCGSPEINSLATLIMRARNMGWEVVWLMGAHVLRRGNSRIIIDLMERGIITHLAVNHAVVIHDFELAYIGATLEDVEMYIKDGRFGNWEETGRFINDAVVRGYKDGIGLGEAVGRLIEEQEDVLMPYRRFSISAAAYRLRIPFTVHKSIGQDITDQHPSADFAALGKTSGDDFLIFTDTISRLEKGVFLNLGSAVMGPEVYLKALSMARNSMAQVGGQIKNFTTAVFDIHNLGDWKDDENIANYREAGRQHDPRYYFRPLKTILIRTVLDGGQSFYIQGDFAETVPALYRNLI